MNPHYPLDLVKDFTPISLVAEFSGVMLVKKGLPVNSLGEFIAYAKAHDGQLNFGSSGIGSAVLRTMTSPAN